MYLRTVQYYPAQSAAHAWKSIPLREIKCLRIEMIDIANIINTTTVNALASAMPRYAEGKPI